MGHCAFLTTDRLDGFVVDDGLAVPAFRDLGWTVREVSWRDPVDWDEFDAVVIRSTWDLTDDVAGFRAVLRHIDSSSAVLLNPLGLVEWNLEKTYLRDLEARGVHVVPTAWGRNLRTGQVEDAFRAFDTDEVVVKPVLGANARDTFRLTPERLGAASSDLERRFAGRDFMLQPFMRAILDEGELSLFFFDGRFSHAVVKRPTVGDFRVQEEHGATIEPLVPAPELRACATRAVATLPGPFLYARADLVRHGSLFRVMELELVEPSLYLRMDPSAPARLARAFDRWMTSNGRAR